jgi:cyclic beta-1,2-glucan glucanotransferase
MVQVSQNISAPTITQNDQRATALAEKLKDASPRKGSFPIPDRLKKLKSYFQAAYSYFESASKSEAVISPASDWLLDNFYILEQALRVVEEDLPSDYYARLPKTKDGWPRIQLLTMVLGRPAPRLDLDQIKNVVQSFQSVTPLQVGELWALPLLLRLTVLETLAGGLAEITKLPWGYVSEPALWKELQSDSDQPVLDADSRVINSILNLRLIATIEWKEFFE